MEATVTFVKAPGETAPAPSVFKPMPASTGRPKTEYRLRIDNATHVKEARKAKAPVYLLTEDTVQALGYPLNMPPSLVVARSILGAVDTTYPTVSFLSEEAVCRPRIEDVAIALLAIDAIGARIILESNRDEVDADYLLRRVFEERVLALATSVRFQDLNPAIPRLGPSVPEAFLARKIRKSRRIR
jgi:hypothetical protein